MVYRSQQVPEKVQFSSLSVSVLTSIVSSAVGLPVSWSAFSHLDLIACLRFFQSVVKLLSAYQYAR